MAGSRASVVFEYDASDIRILARIERLHEFALALGFKPTAVYHLERLDVDEEPPAIPPPEPDFHVVLLAPLRVWEEPDEKAKKSDAALPIGHVHNVWEARVGWLRVDGGWIPNDPRWVGRVK